MRAVIVITTKNRKDDLRLALRSAVSQRGKPGVLVIDDGSTDGTSEMVRAEFPTVRVERSELSHGLIVQRNRAAELAGDADVIFSIDDDAAFSTPNVVAQTLADFDGDPRVGAVAIPFINVNGDNVLHQRAPDGPGVLVAGEYIGTAHAVRRDVFRQLGGYRERLIHQGEERDFCIRLLAAGRVVRLGRADPIHHFESPRRDTRRMDLHGRRNDVLFAWHNVPARSLPAHLLGTTVNGVRIGVRLRRPLRMVRGLIWGYRSILSEWSDRRPVSSAAYELSRRLRRGPLPLSAIEHQLPPLR